MNRKKTLVNRKKNSLARRRTAEALMWIAQLPHRRLLRHRQLHDRVRVSRELAWVRDFQLSKVALQDEHLVSFESSCHSAGDLIF